VNRLRLLFVVALAIVFGFVLGFKVALVSAHQDSRHFLPVPADLAFEPFVVSATPIPGLHEYERPVYVAIPVATAAPGARSSASVLSQKQRVVMTAAKVSGGQGRHHNLSGVARWHPTGRDGRYAAAGCALRKAIRRSGHEWRGRQVIVSWHSKLLIVTLNDAIGGCTKTLLDLSDEAFSYFAPLSRGVLKGASVGW